MSNEDLFFWFTRIVGMSILITIAAPIIGIAFSAASYGASFFGGLRSDDDDYDESLVADLDWEEEEVEEPPVKKRVSRSLNTGSSVKEYRLPDGSKVAFNTTEVEVSERSAI
jgi:hypothetical protein